MWALGGKVRGGIYGNWRGLAANQLYQGRDLPVTTDFRNVVSSVLARQVGLSDAKLNQVFPNYMPQQTVNLV